MNLYRVPMMTPGREQGVGDVAAVAVRETAAALTMQPEELRQC